VDSGREQGIAGIVGRGFGMTATVTTDFREEYEAERNSWLRRRFLWYTGIFGGFNVLRGTVQFVVLLVGVADGAERRASILQLCVSAVAASIYLWAFGYARGRSLARERVLRLVRVMLIMLGFLTLVLAPVLIRVALTAPQTDLSDTAQERIRTIAPLFSIIGVALSHLLACLFIPWTAKEAIRPIPILFGLYMGVSFTRFDVELWVRVVAVLLSPLVFVPGLFFCWWRQSRFRDRFHFKMLKGRYGEIKQDLGLARQIHESLFPKPVTEGAVRFEFRYEPMRQIGGDYLFARFDESEPGREPPLNLAIIDVTGHGIGAALTVNRLHGEIERHLGAHPGSTPGDLLGGLNEYLYHTLANHSVYATAIFVRIDPNSSRLIWASAGHPPALVRTIDGRIERLESTTLVLGACRGDDFATSERSCQFFPGDVLIAYTDGALEARNSAGRMLGVEGLVRIVASARPDEKGGWASAILRAVDAHRFGPPQDDTLFVEVYRPVKIEGATRA